MDLASYGRVAVVAFTSDQSKSSLAVQATQQFAREVLASQGGFELLELGAADSAVARLLAAGDAPAAAQELGRSKNVPAVFFGRLEVSGAKANGRIGPGGNVNVGATVSAELDVRLLSTSTGGTLWRSSASRSSGVGQISTNGGGLPSISATDPNAVYGNMVNQMVAQVTKDFRPTWVKQ
jgi:hypothetical protein